MRAAILATVVGLLGGLLAGVTWFLADHIGNTGLYEFGSDIRSRIVFSDWVIPFIGLAIALGAGFLVARLCRKAPIVGATGVGAGILAVFILPQAVIRSDVSLYLAGPEMFLPTVIGLPIVAVLGGYIGRRTT